MTDHIHRGAHAGSWGASRGDGPGWLRLAVWFGIAVALGAPAFQALTNWGLTASEFSQSGDQTLRVAGYAFSIWGVIYTGLAAYAVRRLLRPGGARERALDGPLALASLCCGLWILAAGADQRWLTVAIIFAGLVAALVGLSRLARTGRDFTWPERLTVLWPIALLAGWLTAASIVNVLTVATAEGLIEPSLRTPAAIVGVLAAGAIAIATLLATRFASYAAPVAWGLVGAFVAERSDQPLVAYAALGCAALLLAVAAVACRPRRASAPGRAG
ncbi:hypothetical protein [Phenylobacterium deserti]|uniref:Tryptophan-rich sensory protein n=1 Tax=Phenylobacterium deserti TaxID=1914756 RepID=A0A328AC61_9CAUL|nr:hypothetical protein [Phenylobacterium deserti]RAK52393.1 hypothetical protein DJ018_14800 [Phenylobacterium deserti]